MEDFEDDDDDEMFEGITETIIPFLRIYISAGKENHDLLEVEDIVDWLTSDNCSITESIKRLLDKGMINVYACSYNRSVKVF
jgi:DNA-binding MarR family transcriptional regulator